MWCRRDIVCSLKFEFEELSFEKLMMNLMKMMNLYKKNFFNAVLVFSALALVISGCSDGVNSGAGNTNAKSSVEKVLVETVTPTLKNFAKELKVVGTVEPLQWVDILPLESGQVSQVLVDLGDSVEKGELLVVLVNPIITREVQALRVEAEAASKQLARIKEAISSAPGLISAADLDEAEATSARASVALSAGEDRLMFLEVRAPISGVVSARNVHPGAVVENGLTSPSQVPMLKIVQCADVRIRLPYPERDMRFISEGANIELHFPDLDRSISTKVSRVAASIDAKSRTVDVMVDLDVNDCSIRPGIYVEGALMGGSKDSIMSLPAGVRFIENGLPFASAVIDGVVKKLPLTIHAEDKEHIAFSSDGTGFSTEFIITGRNLVSEGEAVKTSLRK
ncbi:MAG TPA: efflux RND transporter periplasmic adaptor subunit [Flavobacteriales bacterium]|jgi:RND family efflux transporter MFP subunit|nr:efflux RND transporter periplasmic adaptor subunit [Flavobacteriales bacterium]HIN41230.1 efflux RND transporter periplasmic adaptor subunit [Flavobacteriales bacterium]HIO59060.1 efflux RND transporter periplasmic adaptor subunit [Flavobacteriales bacterium]